MQMPKPGEAHQKLLKLVGSWIGEEVLNPSPWDPKGGTAIGRVQNRLALDGFVVVQDYEQERDGTVTFRGHGVFSWDAEKSEYVLHWFDSLGMPPNVFRGTFEGDVLTVISKESQGFSRAVFEYPDGDHYTFRMEVSQDGEHWQTFAEGTYTRQE